MCLVAEGVRWRCVCIQRVKDKEKERAIGAVEEFERIR